MNQQNFSLADTIILAGSGRSGTTWLGNIIAANPNMRILFEPFDPRRVPQVETLPLFAYARPNGDYPQWAEAVGPVLTGQVENEWINRQGGKRWWAGRRLVKTIRANLMLAWLDCTFYPKIVFTTRHPAAVVLSRVKLGWDAHLDNFLSQPELVTDYLDPFVDVILAAKTPVQQHAAAWCIENFIPLQQMRAHNWIFCTYESLYRHPEAEADRVLTGLGIRKSWFTRRAINRITMVARPDSAIVQKKDPLTDWQQRLTPTEIDDILRMLDTFGITLYGIEPEATLS
jgi:hypothetical protein